MMPTPATIRTPGRNSHSSISSTKPQKDAQWQHLVNEYHNNKFGHYDEELIATIEDTLFGENHSFLNMSGCHENDVRGLEEKSPGIIARLQASGVTEIHLPENLKAIPSWLEKIPHLTSLKMPDVDVPKALGTSLDFRALKQKCPNLHLIRISTTQSAHIMVYENMQVLPSGHASKLTDVVIKVDIYGRDDKPLRQQTLAGRSYYAQYRGAKLLSTASTMDVEDWDRKENLNGAAEFSDEFTDEREPTIECRHLATYWLWQPKNPDGRLLENIVTKMGTVDDIEENIPASIEMRFEEIARQGKENYLVDHDAWGGFMHNQFKQMGNNQTQRIVVQSGSHAMALQLKIKGHKGFPEYVAEFFDPNMTLTHVRKVETDIDKIASWTIKDFMETEAESLYFKGENSSSEDCSLFIKVPENLDTHPMNEPLWVNDNRERTTEFFPTSLHQKKSATAMWHVAVSNLSGELKKQLFKMQDMSSEEKKFVLYAKDSGGNSRLLNLFLNGSPETLKIFLTGIKEFSLVHSDLVDLLSLKDSLEGELLGTIMTTPGKVANVAAFLDGIKELGLNKENLYKLLLAKNCDGITGLMSAIMLNDQKTVEVFLTGFKNLGLDSEDFVKFASEKDENQSCLMKDVMTGVTSDTREHFLSCIQELGLGSSELDELRNRVLSE